MKLTILTPEKKLYEGDVTGVKVPGAAGSFEMLNGHAPIISALVKGPIRVSAASGTKQFEIESGFIECLNNNITVLVEGATELA
jgi:F-type H+-transporting ATPase subunit epsilon